MRIPQTFHDQVMTLFSQMDQAYAEAAQESGFVCNGCRDNCCMTRFYHHTLSEYLYLKSGLAELAPDTLAMVKRRAASALTQMSVMAQNPEPVRVMCPLNEHGNCIIYAHRPMICRLHGIGHVVRRPNGQSQTGPGCGDFYAQGGTSEAGLLDRTPLYVAMANLERQIRQETGFNQKIKMTIAEIVNDDSVKF